MKIGHTNAEIGARLFISPRTVETHRANMMRKLSLRTHTDLIHYVSVPKNTGLFCISYVDLRMDRTGKSV